MKYFETEEFKKLNRQWRKKLKASGFKDIELSDDELVRYSFHLTEAYRSGTFDYYLKCAEFLLTHKFKTQFEKKIWELHTDGLSIRRIVEALKTDKDVIRNNKARAPGTAYYLPLTIGAIHDRLRAIEAHMLQKVVLKTEIDRTSQNKRTGT